MTPLVETARASDIDDLVGLLEQLFAIEKDFDFDEKLQKKGLVMMLESSETRCVMVARTNNKAIGMCSAQLVVSTSEGGFSGIVEDMVVDSRHRGKGLGTKLLQAVERWCLEKGAGRVQLLADRNNEEGLEFYRNQSWAHTELICLRKKFK
jgi:GNAT superfamily N-acetyltransferase